MMHKGFCPLIVIRGAGDMGTGVALELWHAGLHGLVLLECARPRAIRRFVVFSEAVFEGAARVEGLEARLCPDVAACRALRQSGEALPLLVDEDGTSLRELRPQVFVDATMSKKARGLSPDMGDLVIALGPGIEAGRDVHCIIESFGPDTGRCLWQGQALADTGIPCENGRPEQRVGRAPCAGVFASPLPLGGHVLRGQEVPGGRCPRPGAPVRPFARPAALRPSGARRGQGMRHRTAGPRAPGQGVPTGPLPGQGRAAGHRRPL